jgi:hypothetical protein
LHKACRPGVSDAAISSLQDKLSDRATPFSYLVQPSNTDQNCVKSILGTVPIGSVLGYQLKDFKTQLKCTFEIPPTCDQLHETLHYPHLPLKLNTSQLDIDDPTTDPELCMILSKIQLDMPTAHKLNTQTVSQSESQKWRDVRRIRLTASNFGAVIKRKKDPSVSFMSSIFNPPNLSKVASISYGRNREHIAKELYVKKMRKHAKHWITVYDTGLCVNPSLPHL